MKRGPPTKTEAAHEGDGLGTADLVRVNPHQDGQAPSHVTPHVRNVRLDRALDLLSWLLRMICILLLRRARVSLV